MAKAQRSTSSLSAPGLCLYDLSDLLIRAGLLIIAFPLTATRQNNAFLEIVLKGHPQKTLVSEPLAYPFPLVDVRI